MIFTADRVELSSAISRAAQGTPPRPAQPIYSGMHLETDLDADMLHLTTSDGEVRFTSYCPVIPEDAKESCIVPARLLTDMSAYFGGKQIRFERVDQQMVITSGRSRFVVNAIDGEEYPRWEENVVAFAQADGGELAHALRSVAPAATDSGLIALTGINLETEGDKLLLVCTDTTRLAVAEVGFEPLLHWQAPGNVGMSTIREIQRDAFPDSTILPSKMGERFARDVDGPTGIGWTDSLILMQHQGGRLVARKVGEKFLPWRNPFEKNKLGEWFYVDPKELTRAIRMAQLATGPGDRVHLTFSTGVITVQADEEGRECTEQVECRYEGDERAFRFGARELLDGLAGCGHTAEVALSEKGPLFFRSDGFKYMLQPRREL